MTRRRRSGSDSRCCDSEGAPYGWIDYQDHQHPACVKVDEWLNSLAPFARAHELGEIDELFDEAANGRLWDSGDETTAIKPIREDPEVFELRRTALSKKLRFYHGEPDSRPEMLVALNRHIKSGKAAQQLEIEFAADRYRSGRSQGWA